MRASTHALASNSARDATYIKIENALQRLGNERDTVGGQMRALLLGAAGAGSAFTQHGAAGASLGMALATAVAMLCYAVNLVILGKSRG